MRKAQERLARGDGLHRDNATAPALGGFLADPARQYGADSLLGRLPLLQSYPYLLPALVSSCVSLAECLRVAQKYLGREIRLESGKLKTEDTDL